ncbi:glycoside hydrolase [Xanthomonas phage NEB7]|nr:glycoside hydrolase [Xanthomonas phage NEB7]
MTMSTETVAEKLGAGKYAKPIEDGCIWHGIASPLEKAHLIAQLAHESDGFSTAVEYASGAAYEGRADLGNTQKGDGTRFKGRGLIQCTGRSNYAAYSAWKYNDDRCVENPELLAELPDAVEAAFWYWTVRRPVCRTRAQADDLEGVTRAINGGLRGLEDRRTKLSKAKQLFGIL